MIKRILYQSIEKDILSRKALILMGARQTGKTTLLKMVFESHENVLWINADEPDVIALFENPSSTRFRALFGSYRIVVIDEAQRIADVGIKLKLIIDMLPEIQLVATGSSSFELANKINEPLTGRKWEYQLYPLSFQEMVTHHGLLEEIRLLQHRMVYGYYPEVVEHPGNEKRVLKELTNNYLYKDVLSFAQIKKPDKLIKLLQALAFQVGNEVSYNELGKIVGLDNQTVENYILILEQVYIVFRVSAFSRNLRKELKRGRKIYFYDNGIRNALIANYNIPELRQDTGILWENFIVSERKKYISNNNIWSNTYFWRTQDQQEIDYIEDRDGILYAYEIKWNPHKSIRIPLSFSKAYINYQFKVITPDNYEEFLYKSGD